MVYMGDFEPKKITPYDLKKIGYGGKKKHKSIILETFELSNNFRKVDLTYLLGLNAPNYH